MVRITEEMLKAGTDALIEFESEQASKKVSSIDLDTDNFVRVFSAAMEESDRAAAILIFAYIEDCLCTLIERRFDASIASMKELTRPNGLLATSSARLTLIAGLNWVSNKTFDALNLLRKIRNHFAHHVEVASFEHNVISGLIASISDFEKPFVPIYADGSKPRKLSSRERFFLRAAACVSHLIVQGAVFPIAKDHRLGPGDVIKGPEGRPPNVIETYRVTTLIMSHIFERGAHTPINAEWLERGGREEDREA